MKNYLFTIVALLAFCVSAYSTDRTTGVKKLNADITQKNSVTYVYTGTAADSITSNQDTVRVEILANKGYPVAVYANTVIDLLSTADTTVKLELLGKVFLEDTYTSLTSVTTAEITASDTRNSVNTITLPSINFEYDTTAIYPSQSVAIDSAKLYSGDHSNTLTHYYRYFALDIIIQGDDNTGTGLTLDKVQWYVARRE